MEGQTRLLVVDKETDEELRRRQLTCTEEMAQRGLPPAHDPWEPKPDWARGSSLSSEVAQKVWWALPTGTTWALPEPPSCPPDSSLCLWSPPEVSVSVSAAPLGPFSAPGENPLGYLEPLFLPSACALNQVVSGQPGPGPQPPSLALFPRTLLRATCPRKGHSDKPPPPWPRG